VCQRIRSEKSLLKQGSLSQGRPVEDRQEKNAERKAELKKFSHITKRKLFPVRTEGESQGENVASRWDKDNTKRNDSPEVNANRQKKMNGKGRVLTPGKLTSGGRGRDGKLNCG